MTIEIKMLIILLYWFK